MKKSEIQNWFNVHIRVALGMGYSPCMDDLRGSYSDVYGHQMVFQRGNDRIIMWMTRLYGYGQQPDEIVRNVAKIKLSEGDALESFCRWSSDWEEHVTATSSVYEVSHDWYTESREEAEEAERKRRERFEASYLSAARQLKVTSRLLKVVHGIDGFRSIRKRDLMVLRLERGYVVKNTRSMKERVFQM